MTLRSQMPIFTYLLKFLWEQFTVHGRWIKIRNHLFHWMKTISFAKCPSGRGREINIASNKTFRGHYLRLQGNPLGGRCLKFWKLGYHYPPLLSYIVSSPQPLIFKIIKIILHLQKNQSIGISFAHWHVYTFIIFLLCLLLAFWSPSQVCSFVE